MSLAVRARASPADGTSTQMTVAPSRRSVEATVAPMPRAAPVTTAVRPASGLSQSTPWLEPEKPGTVPTSRRCPWTNAERDDRKKRSVDSRSFSAPSATCTRFTVAP